MNELITAAVFVLFALGLYSMVLASFKGMRQGNERVNRL